MIDVCERMLLNVRINLMQDKRTNDEIKSMLDNLKESNHANFDKLKKIYGNPLCRDPFRLMQYEHYEMEKLRKRMYGDDYEIKPFGYEK